MISQRDLWVRSSLSQGQEVPATGASIVCCGRFHYHNYVPVLASYGRLQQFVYSHRKDVRNGAGAAEFINLFWKEYLYQGHLRLIGHTGLLGAGAWYHKIWDMQLKRVLRDARLVQFMLHGNCTKTIASAKNRGAVLLADAVNSHPIDYYADVDAECESLGVRNRTINVEMRERIIGELEIADHLLVPSQYVARSFVSHGFAAEKIHVAPYGANTLDFVPSTAKGSTFKVVCVAQVTARKGHQYLFRAWEILRLSGAELHCFGVIDDQVERRLRGLCGENVYLHGPVDKRRVIQELSSASVFVLPTVEEGFAVSILEAMASGLPSIVTDASGAEGVLVDGRHGYIVPRRSIDALADRLLRLYSDSGLRRYMGEEARALVEAKYNWMEYARNIGRLHEELLGT